MTKGKTGMAQNDFCGQRIQLHNELISTDCQKLYINRPLAKVPFARGGKREKVKESSSLSLLPFNFFPDFCQKSTTKQPDAL
jgi:hypothetical protein